MASSILGLQMNDYGIPLEVDFELGGQPLDLSDATLIQCILDQPDGTGTITRTGAVVTDGSDGKVRYILADGDLTKFGMWRFQFKVVTPTMRKFSRKFELNVESDLV